MSVTSVSQCAETLFFDAGNDVFVGSAGADQFLTAGGTVGGTDFVCANGGNDVIQEIFGFGSVAFGGNGSDRIIARDGATAKGGVVACSGRRARNEKRSS